MSRSCPVGSSARQPVRARQGRAIVAFNSPRVGLSPQRCLERRPLCMKCAVMGLISPDGHLVRTVCHCDETCRRAAVFALSAPSCPQRSWVKWT